MKKINLTLPNLTLSYLTLQETRKLIAEGIEDVHVDPFLEEACARDINSYCKDLPKKSGNGKIQLITLLISVLLF